VYINSLVLYIKSLIVYIKSLILYIKLLILYIKSLLLYLYIYAFRVVHLCFKALRVEQLYVPKRIYVRSHGHQAELGDGEGEAVSSGVSHSVGVFGARCEAEGHREGARGGVY